MTADKIAINYAYEKRFPISFLSMEDWRIKKFELHNDEEIWFTEGSEEATNREL